MYLIMTYIYHNIELIPILFQYQNQHQIVNINTGCMDSLDTMIFFFFFMSFFPECMVIINGFTVVQLSRDLNKTIVGEDCFFSTVALVGWYWLQLEKIILYLMPQSCPTIRNSMLNPSQVAKGLLLALAVTIFRMTSSLPAPVGAVGGITRACGQGF